MSRSRSVTSGREARDGRKTAAADRAATKLSPAQQLQRLDARLGAGVGAAKERARLAVQLATTNKKENAA